MVACVVPCLYPGVQKRNSQSNGMTKVNWPTKQRCGGEYLALAQCANSDQLSFHYHSLDSFWSQAPHSLFFEHSIYSGCLEPSLFSNNHLLGTCLSMFLLVNNQLTPSTRTQYHSYSGITTVNDLLDHDQLCCLWYG